MRLQLGGLRNRLRRGVGLAATLFLAGCTQLGLHDWQWFGYRRANMLEEYTVPPEGDPRYSQPVRYPPSVMKPAIKKPGEETNQGGIPAGSMGPRGMAGGMSGQGAFMR